MITGFSAAQQNKILNSSYTGINPAHCGGTVQTKISFVFLLFLECKHTMLVVSDITVECDCCGFPVICPDWKPYLYLFLIYSWYSMCHLKPAAYTGSNHSENFWASPGLQLGWIQTTIKLTNVTKPYGEKGGVMALREGVSNQAPYPSISPCAPLA